MNTIEQLTEIFKEFPGIGERQAGRFVRFLMYRNSAYAENLCNLIARLKKETAQCRECFRFFLSSGKSKDKCDTCGDPGADPSILMVVEKDSDLESVEKSRIYGGKYFILGGAVPMVEKNTLVQMRIKELIKRAENDKELKEVILAFSMNPQGNYTDFYIRNQLKQAAETRNIKISSLGRGLSTGTELEYSDIETLKNALENRQ